MSAAPIIVLFRQDLRLYDHRALTAAITTGQPIIPVYILDDETPDAWRLGGASRWWLHQSLLALNQELEKLGSRLILRRGIIPRTLETLIEESGATAIYASRSYEPWASGLEKCLADNRVSFKRFTGSLLFEPETLRTKGGNPFRVFTPFYKACLKLESPKQPLPKPECLLAPSTWPRSEHLDAWSLSPTKPDWAKGFSKVWQPGEAGARDRLQHFLNQVMIGYDDHRDRPDRPGTSRLSPHLHFGEISPHQCWHAVQDQLTGDSILTQGSGSFLRELVWREFSYHLLFHWPDLPSKAFRPEFEAFPWKEDQTALQAWQKGQTGYPIVDAGMRELWQTGWMHNRVRMITASFLIKDLLLPWQTGEAWFWDTLVDADLASNAASWQWVAGSGADAAPYFRIFNPVLQGKKFDPEGNYIKRFIPELRPLERDHIHDPWKASDHDLAAAGITLGKTYPFPIADHSNARHRALEAYQDIKKAKAGSTSSPNRTSSDSTSQY